MRYKIRVDRAAVLLVSFNFFPPAGVCQGEAEGSVARLPTRDPEMCSFLEGHTVNTLCVWTKCLKMGAFL